MKHAFSRTDSGAFDPVTKRYLWPPGVNATGRRMLFTGPDGIRNQDVSVEEDNQYVGIGTMSPEGTSELAYLYRPDWRNAPSLLPKHRRVGEIGWGIPMHSDLSVLQTGKQITRGEFRQSAEDRHTHLYQNPWTPPLQSSSRPRTAPVRLRSLRHMDDYLLETDYTRSHNQAPESSSSEVSSHASSHSSMHY